jgi:hypothetical protein
VRLHVLNQRALAEDAGDRLAQSGRNFDGDGVQAGMAAKKADRPRQVGADTPEVGATLEADDEFVGVKALPGQGHELAPSPQAGQQAGVQETGPKEHFHWSNPRLLAAEAGKSATARPHVETQANTN